LRIASYLSVCFELQLNIRGPFESRNQGPNGTGSVTSLMEIKRTLFLWTAKHRSCDAVYTSF